MRPDDEMDRELDQYLFDPAASPVKSVADLERVLRPLRYVPGQQKLVLPARKRTSGRSWRRGAAVALAVAAALFLIVVGLRAWIWNWPEGRPWKVVVPGGDEQQYLAEGEFLRVGDDAAVVRIARIGRMRVAPDSEVQLLATRGNRHWLAVERGSLSIGIWAPPFSVAIRTPAGMVYDMGCAFDLSVDGETTAVEVTSGWVQLENSAGEVLVPEGAASRMVKGDRASVPVFLDAREEFRAAVQRVEKGEGTPADLEVIRTSARLRDVYTILFLAERTPFGRATLLERAAELAPPPSPDVRARAATGDRRALWEWAGTLELPPPKGWVRNWRDALPRG
jgi:hypothetical protein